MRVLLVKMTSMGDVFHALPAVSELKSYFPDVVIDWLVDEQFAEIPLWSRHINRVFSVPLRQLKKDKKWSGFSALRVVLKEIRKQQYDLIVDAQGLLKSALISRSLCAKQRHGYAKGSIREPIASCFYTHQHVIEFEQHAVTRLRQLFAASLGYSYDDSRELDYGLRLQHVIHKKPQQTLLCFPCTSWPSKHWPVEYWRELFSLLDDGRRLIQLAWGSAKDREYALHLSRGFNHVELLPSTTITEVCDDVKQVHTVIAVDAGFAHLPQMFGVPLVALYGASSLRRTGPLAKRQRILSAEFSCSPCFKRQCQFKGDSKLKPACYETVTPSTVNQAVLELLSDSVDLPTA